jgi:hypothetical protein
LLKGFVRIVYTELFEGVLGEHFEAEDVKHVDAELRVGGGGGWFVFVRTFRGCDAYLCIDFFRYPCECELVDNLHYGVSRIVRMRGSELLAYLCIGDV